MVLLSRRTSSARTRVRTEVPGARRVPAGVTPDADGGTHDNATPTATPAIEAVELRSSRTGSWPAPHIDRTVTRRHPARSPPRPTWKQPGHGGEALPAWERPLRSPGRGRALCARFHLVRVPAPRF